MGVANSVIVLLLLVRLVPSKPENLHYIYTWWQRWWQMVLCPAELVTSVSAPMSSYSAWLTRTLFCLTISTLSADISGYKYSNTTTLQSDNYLLILYALIYRKVAISCRLGMFACAYGNAFKYLDPHRRGSWGRKQTANPSCQAPPGHRQPRPCNSQR